MSQTLLIVIFILNILILIVLIGRRPAAHPITDQSAPAAKKVSGGLVLDSNILIDGRIEGVFVSGFTSTPLYVPQPVIAELQTLADSKDAQKRTQGRRGLDTAQRLLKQYPGSFRLVSAADTVPKPVDDMLLELARVHDATLCTTDANLQKVARISGLPACNLNELAQAVRSLRLPGEKVNVELFKKGDNPGQAIGYLDDGSLVVVEGGSKYIGRKVTVMVTKAHQTSSGRMVFAKLLTRTIS